jgi:hypothetical protein
MSSTKETFLTKARKSWMVKTFQGLFLLMAAGAVGESFLKLALAWKLVVIGAGLGAFIMGFLFAKVETSDAREA